MQPGRVGLKALGVAVAAALLALPSANLAFASGWAVQRTSNPSAGSFFHGVSCSSSNACTAVGDFLVGGGQCPCQASPLAERWDGVRWSLEPTPALGGDGGGFDAVSCPSRVACMAVGSYSSVVAPARALAERWDGARWSIQPLSEGSPPLTGVSCPSIRLCVAVGENLAERWNGARLTIQRIEWPFPAKDVQLQAVSCTSTSACTAVGSFIRGDRKLPLVERWNGRRWLIQRPAYPPGRTRPGAGFDGVSCSSTTACTAIGRLGRTGLVEQWKGTSWAVERFARGLGVSAVSCPSNSFCMLVGDASAERLGGSPSPTQPLPAVEFLGGFSGGVSCPTSFACTAVGTLNLGSMFNSASTVAAQWTAVTGSPS
jgi:hypothetical protein